MSDDDEEHLRTPDRVDFLNIFHFGPTFKPIPSPLAFTPSKSVVNRDKVSLSQVGNGKLESSSGGFIRSLVDTRVNRDNMAFNGRDSDLD